MTPDDTRQHSEWRERPERSYDRFRVRIRGRDAAGKIFKVTTFLDNIGEGGLYVRLDQRVAGGAPLSLFVSFSTARPGAPPRAPRLSARGVVLRSEPLPEGLCGVAVLFTRHRFLKGLAHDGAAEALPVNCVTCPADSSTDPDPPNES
jgi:hypothetical protein